MSEFDGHVGMCSVYYNRIFPLEQIKTWLTYDDESNLLLREFAYILDNGTFARHESFQGNSQQSDFIIRRRPMQMLLGAIYNSCPSKKDKDPNFAAKKKEVVFDIDLTSYDDIRTCCAGKKMCAKCWILMEIATKVLDPLLRIDFGLKDLLWVFSGRRGVHCIVCDPKVHRYNSDSRRAMVSFANVVREQTKAKMVTLADGKVHASVRRAIHIIEPYINRIVAEQNVFGSDERMIKYVEAYVPDKDLQVRMKNAMLEEVTSIARWEKFVEMAKSPMCKELGPQYEVIVEELMLQLTYPRFDWQVTVQVAHLYKIPFSIHHVNGKISVPFDPNLVEQFDPFAVPSLRILENEMNTNFNPSEAQPNKHYVFTSLNNYVMYFESWLKDFLVRNKFEAK